MKLWLPVAIIILIFGTLMRPATLCLSIVLAAVWTHHSPSMHPPIYSPTEPTHALTHTRSLAYSFTHSHLVFPRAARRAPCIRKWHGQTHFALQGAVCWHHVNLHVWVWALALALAQECESAQMSISMSVSMGVVWSNKERECVK